MPLMNWKAAQMPMATMAGTGTSTRKRNTVTRFVGNITM